MTRLVRTRGTPELSMWTYIGTTMYASSRGEADEYSYWEHACRTKLPEVDKQICRILFLDGDEGPDSSVPGRTPVDLPPGTKRW